MALNCRDIIDKHIGHNMSEKEVWDFANEGEKLLAQAEAAAKAAGTYPDIKLLTEQWRNRHKLALVREKYAKYKNAAARMAIYNHAIGKFKGMEAEGISSMMVGSKYLREGGKYSVDSYRTALRDRYIGKLATDLQELNPGYIKILQKGAMDKQIAEALWAIDNPNAHYAGPKSAMEIAEKIHEIQEIARIDENMAGAYIAKIPGYITRQSHDPARLRKAGFETWRKDIESKLNWDETADGRLAIASEQEKLDFLHEVYLGLVTGIHEKYTPAFVHAKGDPLVSPSHIGSTAAKASAKRVLHFLSGGDWHEYNVKYGRGNLLSSVVFGLRRSANDTALMRFFGPSPHTTLENVMRDIQQTLKSREDFKGNDKFVKEIKRLHNQMKELDGTLNIEGNPSLAAVGQSVRAIESMSKLGSAAISAFADIPNFAQEMAYQGRPYFQSYLEALDLLRQGRGTVEERQILASLGVLVDSLNGQTMATYSGHELPGKISSAMDVFFKFTGLPWWTDSLKKAAGLMMSHHLATERHLSYAQLSHQRRRVLSLYDIDEGIWDMMRKQDMKALDGKEYFTPDAGEHIDINEIKNYLNRRGDIVNDQRAEQFREEIIMRFRTYFRDRVQHAVLEPDARTQSIMHQGLEAGTVTGELIRCAMQFKSFPIVFLQRAMGREIYGRGADSIKDGIINAFVKNEHGERSGLMALIAMTTLFGYMSMTVKQALRGINPRDPFESPEDFAKVFLASFVQGGGAGIYGDFLFGQRSRMGGTFYDTLGGPALGSVNDIYDVYLRIRDGEDAKSAAFRAFWNHVPGNNLFYLRTAADYLFLHSVYEFLNPGYMRRFRRRIEKENNQTFWLDPNIWSWAYNSPFRKPKKNGGFLGPIRYNKQNGVIR